MQTSQNCLANPQISFYPFTSSPAEKCCAAVVDWGECGLCFKSPKPLHKGQYICIQSVRFERHTVGLRSSTIAQVQGCDEKHDQHPDSYVIRASYLLQQSRLYSQESPIVFCQCGALTSLYFNESFHPNVQNFRLFQLLQVQFSCFYGGPPSLDLGFCKSLSS